jgi:hypothetical protein
MRQLLFAAVSAVLWSTAAGAADPSRPAKATAEVPVAKPADAKTATAGGATNDPAIPAGWSWETSREGGFRAAFPAKPEVKNTTLESSGGKSRVITYEVTLENDGGYILVAVSKFPSGFTRGLEHANVMLDSARNGMLTQAHARLVTEKPVVMVDGPGSGGKRSFPSRDYEATMPQGFRLSARSIITNDRMYQIAFMSQEEKPEAFNQFLSTFSLQ